MLARNYTDRITIWQDVSTPDGYGGFINIPTIVMNIWSKKNTRGASFKFQQLGLNDFKQPVIFAIRGTTGITFTEKNYIIFKGQRFNIKSIENVDLKNLEINILADAT